jgi:hypothetical protein
MPRSQDDLASLPRHFTKVRQNVRLIEEHKSDYVLAVGVPFQIIKEERRLRDRIAGLEWQLGL